MVVGGFADSSVRIYDLEAAAARRTRVAKGEEDGGAGGPGGADALDDMDWEDEAGGESEASKADSAALEAGAKGASSRARPEPGQRNELTCLWGHSGPVYALSWAANERYLLSASADSTVRLWNMELGTNLTSYHGHNHPVWAVEASPQGHYFASASADKTARVWSTEHRRALRLLVGHQSDVDCLAWHPSCNYLATGSTDTTVRLWHVAGGSCARIFVGHRAGVCSLAVSPCGRQLASGSVDGSICLWDIAEGRRLAALKGHRGPVWALDYSHGLEGPPVLASGGADCTIRFWGTPAGGATQTAAARADAGDADTAPAGLAAGVALLRTFPTKSIPIHQLRFTTTNLLTATGALTLRQKAVLPKAP